MEGATLADAAVQQLVAGGLSVCFGNPGTTEMFLVAALERQKPGLRSILCLHEAVCTGACDGYARMSGSPAVALLHLGPGLGNGLCNLHNAHRARSPVLVLVGEHATWHKAADPPLAQNIQALAATVSREVLTVSSPEGAASTLQQALEALAKPARIINSTDSSSSSSGGGGGGSSSGPSPAAAAAAVTGVTELTVQTCPGSRVVTLVFPHDVSWTPAAAAAAPTAAAAAAAAAPTPAAAAHVDASGLNLRQLPLQQGPASLQDSPGAQRFLSDCAAALVAAAPRKAAIVLGGAAMLVEGDALANAGRIAAAVGAALLCDPLPGRISRGAGLPHCSRLPYFPQEAAAELAKYDVLLLVDIRRPAATFGYKDGPSQLLQQPDDNVWELDGGLISVSESLAHLVQLVPGAAGVRAGVNCGGRFATAARPALPVGRLTAAGLCQTVAALQPPGTVLVDESLTSGNAFWEASKGCPCFDHLCLTGGAIGSGPPMSVGAAVAAPQRQVINLQADGSAMYTLQALWTQAREQLKVLTIICANNTYAILKVEAMRQRTGQANSLTSLARPAIDWVALASGMGVAAWRAETCEQLAELMRKGLQEPGPFLIHAALG